MEYSNDILTKVEQYASLFLTAKQICSLLDLNWLRFRDDFKLKNNPLRGAYEKGKLSTILELRKQEIDLAKLGSPMAIDLVNKYSIEQKQGETI